MTAEKLLQQPFCKPLLHRMAVTCPFPQPIPPHHGDTTTTTTAATTCHLHANPSPRRHEKMCPVHGESSQRLWPQSTVSRGCGDHESSSHRASVACSPREKRHDDYEADFISEGGDGESARGVKRLHDAEQGGGSWSAQQPEKDLKKACEKLWEQIQWKSEKRYQEVERASFREIVQCQAALHALHEGSVERSSSRGAYFRRADFQSFRESDNYNDYNHRPVRNRDSLSLGHSHSSFSDATFARSFRECCKERPISAPTANDRLQRITSPGRRSVVPEDLLQRYSASTHQSQVISKGVNNVACKGVKPQDPSPSLRNDRFRSKSADQKKPRFCTTGLNRGKGQTMPEEKAGGKKLLNVLPVIMLQRDKTKGVWNRKANQKEWDRGHRGCCSQHWISVLDNNEKVFHADGRKSLSARASLSPIPKGSFAAMAAQKLKVQGERCRPQVARSFNSSSSPLSSLKAIVNDMSRPQSASLPKRSNSVSTPRSASTCKSEYQKPSISITPARKLNNPELHSSAWLLGKMEALRNEKFTEPKALQIAKEHGIMLDKEDEAALKKFLQSEKSPRRLDRSLDAAERERNKTHEKYFSLSNLRLAESAVAARKVKKQLSPKAHAARMRECYANSTSDLLVASDHNS